MHIRVSLTHSSISAALRCSSGIICAIVCASISINKVRLLQPLDSGSPRQIRAVSSESINLFVICLVRCTAWTELQADRLPSGQPELHEDCIGVSLCLCVCTKRLVVEHLPVLACLLVRVYALARVCVCVLGVPSLILTDARVVCCYVLVSLYLPLSVSWWLRVAHSYIEELRWF